MVRIERVTLSMEWIVVTLVLLGNKLDCSGRKVTTTSNPRIRTHDVRDYCENESFRAACGSDEVIIMSTALYGRMQFGKCIDRDYGYVGCQTDVLSEADRQCSGLQTCELNIPFQPFTDKATCPKDLKPYLQASFQCLKVDTVGSVRCRSPDGIRLRGQHGYIASIVTRDSNAGSADCPWVIEADEGQRINLTLHDFGTSDTRPETCHAYAIVRESDKPPPRSDTICSSNQRVRHAYLSTTNRVDIRVLGENRMEEGDRQFILEYSVVGCVDIKPSPSMRVTRRGNEASIQCSGSDTVWKLKCDGNKWIGSMGNCSDGNVGAVNQRTSWGFISLPFGLSVAVIVIIALVIGTVFMMIGLMCLRCKRKATEAQARRIKDSQYYTGYMGNQIPKDYIKRELPWPPPPSESEPTYAEENEYSYIAELPPPPPSAGGMGSSNYPEPPKYFELDPDHVHVAANGERYVISGVVDGRGIMPNGAVSRKDIEKRLNKQTPKNYSRSNSSTGHDTYNPKIHSRVEDRYSSDVGQNHVSI